MTINVNTVNDAPTSTSATITKDEDTNFTFLASNDYTDVEGSPLSKIKLQSASAGTLWIDTDGNGSLNGEAAVANDDILPAADITKLTFSPKPTTTAHPTQASSTKSTMAPSIPTSNTPSPSISIR